MKDFLNNHWEKLALIMLFIFMVFVEVHLIHHGDDSAREWGETLASQILSGVLGFSAGKAVGTAQAQKSQGNQP